MLPFSNNSSVPADVNYITYKHLSTVTFSAKYVRKTIQTHDSNKAHGHENISIRMLKICGDSICVPLQMIFKQALVCFLRMEKRKYCSHSQKEL